MFTPNTKNIFRESDSKIPKEYSNSPSNNDQSVPLVWGFTNSLGLRLNIKEVVHELITFIKAGPEHAYKIIIGSDSLRLHDKGADFVTAVVVHRVGNGGKYFWRRADFGKFHTLRDRIIQEVMLSLDVAKEVLEALKNHPEELKWDFEIHADVGEVGETRALIQEVVGIIRANNFEAKTKPDSYAASKVADRHVVGYSR